jgi:16S rRNA (guanine527-N7)-methyltransferase
VKLLVEGACHLGINLTPGQTEQFEAYYRLLAEWNQRINLTSVIDYDEVQVKHFLDSMAVITALEGSMDNRGAGLDIIDVGAGAGLPGVAVKIVLDRSRLVLLDSVGKKTTFIKEVVRQLGLADVEVINTRAEDAARLPQYREKFGIVLARALAKMPVLAELTLPFCRIGGTVIAQKKGDFSAELAEAASAIKLLGGRIRENRRVELKELSDNRYLVVLEKVAATPAGYPRQAGTPQKRPIK